MATKNIQMNLYNGSDYDVLYPQTTAAQASAVPTTRTVNGKALSSNITLSASDVSALPISGGTLSGNLTIKNSNNFGTKINFGDGDYVYLSEPKDDCLEIKAKKVNIVTSDTSSTALTHNGSAIGGGGISTPVSIANGGTGSTTASSAVYNLLNGLSTRSASQVNSYASSTYLGGYYSSTGYKIPISSLLTYIQNNASANSDSVKVDYGIKTASGTSYFTITTTLTTIYCAIVTSGGSVENATYPNMFIIGISSQAVAQVGKAVSGTNPNSITGNESGFISGNKITVGGGTSNFVLANSRRFGYIAFGN